MSSEFDEFMSEGVADLLDLVGTVEFTINGAGRFGGGPFTGSYNAQVKTRLPLDDGGYIEVFLAQIVAKRLQFTAAPEIGHRVEIDDESRRIAGIGKDAADVYTITLESADK